MANSLHDKVPDRNSGRSKRHWNRKVENVDNRGNSCRFGSSPRHDKEPREAWDYPSSQTFAHQRVSYVGARGSGTYESNPSPSWGHMIRILADDTLPTDPEVQSDRKEDLANDASGSPDETELRNVRWQVAVAQDQPFDGANRLARAIDIILAVAIRPPR